MSGLESYNKNTEPQFPIQNKESADFIKWVQRGDQFYAENELDRARDAYTNALLCNHGKGELLFGLYKNLGNICMREGDFDAAEEYYNKAYTINSRSSVLMVNYGSLAIMRRDLAKAVQCFRSAVEIDALNAKAWTGLATIHREHGDHELAWANVERALDIEPHFTVAIQLVIDWAIKDSEIERSIRLIERYLRYQPTDTATRLSLAKFLYLMGRLENAYSEVQAVIRKDATSADAQSLFYAIQSERTSRDTRFK